MSVIDQESQSYVEDEISLLCDHGVLLMVLFISITELVLIACSTKCVSVSVQRLHLKIVLCLLCDYVVEASVQLVRLKLMFLVDKVFCSQC